MEKYITIERKRKVAESTSDAAEPNNNEIINIDDEKLKKRRRNNFSLYWENDEELTRWLVRGNNDLPRCRICEIDLKAAGGKKDLYAHAKTTKHKQKSEAINIHEGSEDIIKGLPRASAHAEIRLSAFCAEHNIPFLAMDHLVPMINNTFDESKTAKLVACGRTKTTAIVKNVIGKSQLEFLLDLMRRTPFSLCADESTDISATKILSLVVRIEFDNNINDFFLTCIPVSKCDSYGIHSAITDFFVENKVNYKETLFGFAADGANVMTGGEKSVAVHLKKDCPHLIIIKCTCHSLALCSSKACAKLPDFVESTVRDIYNIIANSPKRIAFFSTLQAIFDLKPLKILHPSQTRWLSLEAAVVRILDHLDVIELFLIGEDVVNLDSAKRILENLKNPLFKIYLTFLKFILKEINKINKLFQSEAPQIHSFNQTLHNFCSTVLDFFTNIQNENIQFMSHISLNSEEIKAADDIYFGAEVELLLLQTNVEIKADFTQNALNFYITLCNEMFKRFDFKNDILKSIDILAPINVIQKKNISIVRMINNISYLSVDNIQSVDSEWRQIRNLDFKSLGLFESTAVEIFWKRILCLKRVDGTLCYPLMKNIVWTVLTMPVSTANVERIFSQINLNKTKTRNRLNTDTLSGILLTKDYIKRNGGECYSLPNDIDLLKNFKNDMYKKLDDIV